MNDLPAKLMKQNYIQQNSPIYYNALYSSTVSTPQTTKQAVTNTNEFPTTNKTSTLKTIKQYQKYKTRATIQSHNKMLEQKNIPYNYSDQAKTSNH